MNESLTVPTATTFRVIPVAALEAHRARLNTALAAAGRGEKISFTHLIGYAIVRAVKVHPSMVDALAVYDGVPHRLSPASVGLGIAVDMERKDGTRGLVVPVIKAADTLDFRTFHATYESLIEKARTSKLMPDDFTGGTIQLTNPGGLGTVASVPRLMAGQGTIVAVGAISYPPEYSTVSAERIRELGISKVMTITSTYDHRVIQGAESGSFLRTIERLLSGTDPFYEAIAESLGLPAATGIPVIAVAPAARAVAEPSAASPDELARVAAAHGAGEGVPHPRAPGRAARSAGQRADRRSRARPRHARARAGRHGADPGARAPRGGGRRHAGRGVPAAPGDLLRDHRVRGRAHLRPRGAGLASERDRVGGVSQAAGAGGSEAAPGPTDRGGDVRALPAQGLPRPEALLDRRRGRPGADARPRREPGGRAGGARGGDRHGPPRPAQRAGAHHRAPLRDHHGRVRGPQGAPRGTGRRHRRREIPPRCRGHPPERHRQDRRGERPAQPESPRVRRSRW